MEEKKEKFLVYACNGVSGAGQLTTAAALEMRERGACSMGCLAGVGAGIDFKVEDAKAAPVKLALDGCNLRCAAKILERAGAKNVISAVVSDSGITVSGKRPAKEEIDRFVDYVLSKV